MPTSPQLPTRLRRLALLARARLLWETYAPVLAVPALALSLYLIASLLGAWEVLGDPVRLLALAAMLYAVTRGVLRARRQRVPTRSDALRRLEATAGLAHRPLDTLQDTAVLAPDLWPAHAKTARADADTIRKVGRTPALTPIDRYGLRVVMPIALGLAVFLSLGVSWERLRHGLTPGWLPFTNPAAVRFEAWVDPPDYTGRPPIYAQGDGPISAPEGSTLVVRASGVRDLPRPVYREDGARRRFLDLRRLGETSQEVRTIVDASGTLDWRVGWRREAWSVTAAPDAPPEVGIEDPVETDKQDRLVVTFDASDDYGVDRLVLEMVELQDGMSAETAFDGAVATAETDAGAFKAVEGRTLKLDLTRHPLAGRKVIGRLVAIDGAGQRGLSAPVYFTVPDKIFVEPLAKAIAEQRTLLIAGTTEDADYTPPPKMLPDNDASDGTFDTLQTQWRLGRAPAPVQRTAALIDAVTLFPDPSTFNDPVVYMGLRHVGKTLRYARSAEALRGLPDHMWKLAIRAEFGVLGTALQEMQEAEAALREGIARRAPEREIDTLFERYNQAVDAWMEELRKNATVSEGGEGGGGPSMGSTDEIQALLDAIEEANARGDTEGARQALAQLAELLENMQIQLSQSQGGGGDGDPSGEMSEAMRENLEELAESLADQRELEDQTRQAEREELANELNGGEEGEGASVSPEELARRQAEIETLLDGLRERLGEDGDPAGGAGEDGDAQAGSEPGGDGEAGSGAEPGERSGEQPGGGGDEGDGDGAGGGSALALERAGEAMRDSRDALGAGDLAGSRRAQREAIEALRDAGDALSREAMAQGEPGESTDPLGRNTDGFNSDNAEADIEEKDNATRSREILDELRRRAAEAEREQEEREYLDRLLKRF